MNRNGLIVSSVCALVLSLGVLVAPASFAQGKTDMMTKDDMKKDTMMKEGKKDAMGKKETMNDDKMMKNDDKMKK